MRETPVVAKNSSRRYRTELHEQPYLSLKEGLISSVNSVNRSQALRSVSASPAFANSLSSASRPRSQQLLRHDGDTRAMVNLRYLHRLLSLRPPCFHHRRQLLPHGCTHRLATYGFLGNGRTLFRPRFAFLLCPSLLHSLGDALACCRAQTATFLATCWLSRAPLSRTTTPYGLGT